MYAVIEFYCAGINVSGAHSGKFRMAGIKSVDVPRVMSDCPGCVKICVALRATRVTRSRQSHGSAMLAMARGAIRRENLVRVVNGAVVASLAGAVAGLGAENGDLFHVAGAATFGQHGMARRHFAAAVYAVVASNREPPEPDQRQYRYAHRQNKTQS